MKKWSILLMIAVVAMLMPMFTANVSAQEELSITKTADPNPASVGDTITYTYTITNNSAVAISGIILEDDPLGPIDLAGQTSLDAGQSITATTTYTVLDTDLPGPLENTATVSGTDPDGNPVSANTTASVELTYTASLKLTKTAAPSPAAPHETIIYTYTITNDGPVTISGITLEDNPLGAIDLGGQTSLDPGATTTATASRLVTIDDLPGPIENTATVTGTAPNGTSVSNTTEVVSVPLYVNKSLLYKWEILWLSGVKGKGITKAPGLQKPFNPKSRAAFRAGKKAKNGETEELQIMQSTENHGAAKGHLKIKQNTQNQHQ